MGVMQEDFARCKCGHGYFEEKAVSVIAKASTPESPVILKREVVYFCQKCMTAQYKQVIGGDFNV